MTPSWCLDEPDLSTSFDDSMSGIGSDFVGSMFNMSDALSALPLCDEPTFVLDEPPSGNQDPPVISCAIRETIVSSQSNFYKFDTYLKASTSCATKYNEPSLTYLNQGQTYDLVMHRTTDNVGPTKSVIKLCFHDHRLEPKEQELVDCWRQAHPGERLLDIDLSRSVDHDADVYVDPCSPSMIACFWRSNRCTVGVRLNCIGTEFTAKKHGGEKGVPFRLQVDHFDGTTETYQESCAAQVKVFRLKGADRKHKTDHEKLERKPKEGRALYQPACPITQLLHFRNNRLVESLKALPASKMSESCINAPSSDKQCDVSSVSAPTEKPEEDGPQSVPIGLTTDGGPADPSSTFIAPAQPLQRPPGTIIRLRRSSPVPMVSPTQPSPPSRRHPTGIVTWNWPRRRQRPPRFTDCCSGNCSACGRSCRGTGGGSGGGAGCGGGGGSSSAGALNGRWTRLNKNRSCAHVDTIGLRAKQPVVASWLTEKRRASPSYERDSGIGQVHKFDMPDPPNDNEFAAPAVELSTSAESSGVGNEDEVSLRPPTMDRRRRPEDSDSCLGLSEPQQRRTHTPHWQSGGRDAGYVSDLAVFPVTDYSEEPDYQPKLMRHGWSPVQEAQSMWELPLGPSGGDMLPAAAEPTKTDRVEESTRSDCDDKPTAQTTAGVHVDWSADQVVDWLKASNFANLTEKFKMFTGRDMLRLTREDFFLLCGSVEGLRLHNALYSRPARPRCTLYLSRREKFVFQAVMLYELTKVELLRHVSSIAAIPTDQIHMLCLLTPHNLPVLITDELICHLKDRSSYQIETHWHSDRKTNVFLRPIS